MREGGEMIERERNMREKQREREKGIVIREKNGERGTE